MPFVGLPSGSRDASSNLTWALPIRPFQGAGTLLLSVLVAVKSLFRTVI
jgi:hypothetical protein